MNTTNHTAWIGFTSRIRNAPIAVPINAPNTGISAVKPTSTDIAGAYGMRNIDMPIKHKAPMMTASVSWPVMKFVNVRFIRSSISRSFCIFSGFMSFASTFFDCRLSVSF